MPAKEMLISNWISQLPDVSSRFHSHGTAPVCACFRCMTRSEGKERSLQPLDLVTVLRDAHENEINATIATFACCGGTIKIGDPLNGFVIERSFNPEEFHLLGDWLARAICTCFPNTWFAKHYDALAPHFADELGGIIEWEMAAPEAEHIEVPIGVFKAKKFVR